MLWNRFFLLVSFSFATFFLSAQDDKPVVIKRCPVKTINFETGLINNGSTDIITDNLGFTWVATRIGLQRYNGYSLQTITPIIGKDTFRINCSVYFFGLKDGAIWISFKQHILQYDPVSNSFSHILSLLSVGNSPFNTVPLKETAEGIWCMQENKGIVVYSRNGKLLKQYSFFEPSLINKILNSGELLYLNKITRNDNHIFISENGGNNIYTSINRNAGSVLAINTQSKAFQKINLPDSNVLGIACIQNKLCVLSNTKLFFISSDDYKIKKQIALKSIINENATYGSIRFADNGMLLLGANNHLFELNEDGNNVFELTDLNRNPVVPAGFIHQIYPDKLKRIWVITNNDIKRIENLEVPFAHFIYPDEKNNFVRSVYYDKQKNILLAACFYSGMQLYDTLANPLLKETIPFKNLLSVEKLTNNEYLVTAFDKGWFLFNLSTRTFRPFNIPSNFEAILQPRQINFVNGIQRINDSTLMIAMASNVFRCEFAGTNLLSAKPLLPNRPELRSSVTSFLYDSNKNLWAGTFRGELFHVNPTGEIEIFHVPEQYGIRCLAEDIKHNVWVGTEKGLYVFNDSGKILKAFTRENGLRNDCIYAMLPLDTGAAVFASSNLGLSMVSLNGTVKNFSKEMGLQENEFNTGAARKAPSGKFYFGGINGITAFYPASLSVITDTPFIYITKLVVNDSLYNSSAGTWKGDSILLNYKQNRLRFDLAAIGLLNTNEYVYQYRMTSFENSWQTTYQPTGINYTLGPGKYLLEIVCHPILSSDISFSKKFTIIIFPPWWQTWWFLIAAVALLTGIIGFIVQQYNRRKYMKKIRALQTQYEIQQERERISRDLHDNIGVQANALLYGTEQLQKLQPGETALVDNLQSTAKDMMQSLRETVWAMKNTNARASDIWLRIISFCKQLNLFYKEIKINVEGETPENLVLNSAKTLHIVLIIQEAINNAVRHAKAQRIIVRGNMEENGWLITIDDDGHGFGKESDGKAAGGGFGLSNMRERAAIAGISLKVSSQLKKGTSITLFIPFESISDQVIQKKY